MQHGAANAAISLSNTTEFFIKAQGNKVDYRIFISLPKGYLESNQKYPTIYFLDSDQSFPLFHVTSHFLADRDLIENAIVVGIGYKDHDPNIPDGYKYKSVTAYKLNRTRDYLPIKTVINGGDPLEPHHVNSGKANQFRDFIEHELIPTIEKKYRTSSERSIFGHSYGGLFAMWVLLTKKDMFDNYVMVSPSFWYEDNWIHSLGIKKYPIDKRLYFLTAEGDSSRLIEQTEKMVSKLQRLATKEKVPAMKLELLKYTQIPNEDHTSIMPIGVAKGMRFALEKVKPIEKD